MSEYLVETYASPKATASDRPGPDDVALAVEGLTAHLEGVRLLQTILIPEDETALYLFEAPSSRPVLEIAARLGLSVDRIVEAISG